jgi:hypothetical protein
MPFDDGGDPIGFTPPGDFGSGVVQAIINALNFLWGALLAVIAWVWNILVALANTLLTIFKNIGKFLLTVWNDYIKKGILWLASHVQKIRDWLKRTLSPVVKFFQKLKAWYDKHILAQQLRLIQIIQRIRRFLGILRLFHIGWAAKLDNALADVQQRIEQQIAFIRGIFNQIINTLALVLDPTLFITRNVLGGSLLGNLGAIKRIFGYGDNRILSASEQATIDHDSTLFYKTNVDAYVHTLVTTGVTDEDKARDEEFRLALEAATNTTIPA